MSSKFQLTNKKIIGHKWTRKLALRSPQEAHLLTGETLLDDPGLISKAEDSASQVPEALPETEAELKVLNIAKRMHKFEVNEKGKRIAQTCNICGFACTIDRNA